MEQSGDSVPSTDNVVPNITTEVGSKPEVDLTFIWIWPVLITVIALGVLGNCLILYAIWTVKKFRRPVNYLLANLSFISLLSMISAVSASLQKQLPLFYYGPWTCRIYPVHMSTLPAEGFTVMWMSLDRTRIVRRPLERETMRVAGKKIVCIWAASLSLNLVQGFLFWDYDASVKDFKKCSDRDQSAYGGPYPYFIFLIIYFIVVFLLPCLIMVQDLFRLTRQLRFLRSSCQVWTVEAPTSYHERRERLVKNAMIFALLFIMLKLPSGTHYIIYRMPRGVLPDAVYDWSWEWRKFFFGMLLIHGSFYPFIVFCLSNQIREYFSCCCPRT